MNKLIIFTEDALHTIFDTHGGSNLVSKDGLSDKRFHCRAILFTVEILEFYDIDRKSHADFRMVAILRFHIGKGALNHLIKLFAKVFEHLALDIDLLDMFIHCLKFLSIPCQNGRPSSTEISSKRGPSADGAVNAGIFSLYLATSLLRSTKDASSAMTSVT